MRTFNDVVHDLLRAIDINRMLEKSHKTPTEVDRAHITECWAKFNTVRNTHDSSG